MAATVGEEDIVEDRVETGGVPLVAAAERQAWDDVARMVAVGTTTHSLPPGVVPALANALVDVRDDKGNTALHWAATHGHTPTVQLLLACGADPNAPGEDGWTPVLWAAHQGCASTLAALLAAGGDANVTVEEGEGSLAQVVFWGHGDAWDRLQVLLGWPALDLSAGHCDGVSPEQLAREAGRSAMADAIAQEVVYRGRWSRMRSAWVSAVLCSVIWRRHGAMQSLLNSGY